MNIYYWLIIRTKKLPNAIILAFKPQQIIRTKKWALLLDNFT